MTSFDFAEQLEWANGFKDAGIAQILKARIPACYDVQKADEASDRSGTDYWALRHDLPPLSIDCKVRRLDPIDKYGEDDLALETWSVKGRSPGWTRDETKRTDYILWFWTTSGRFELVPFPPLCKAFSLYWERWSAEYGPHEQNSGRWQSECVFVPRDVIKAKIADWCSGRIK